MRFTRYSELMSHMLLVEKDVLLLLDNSRERPLGTNPIRSPLKLIMLHLSSIEAIIEDEVKPVIPTEAMVITHQEATTTTTEEEAQNGADTTPKIPGSQVFNSKPTSTKIQ
jgi:hypothetical protein